MKKLSLCLLLLLPMLLACTPSRKISYFKDAELVNDNEAPVTQDIILVPGDQLQFQVCVNNRPEITNLFFITETNRSTDPRNNYFIVDADGNLHLPVVGTVKAANLTRSQLENAVRQKIIDSGYGNNVTVTATHLNATFTLVGEVNQPGRFTLDRDNVTILEALAMGKDLTLNGRRDNVVVVRNVDGIDNAYTIDLRSLREVVSSPAYYLQNNDIVYVQPTDKRIREASSLGNDLQTTDFWLQLTTLEIRIIKLLDDLNK